jgi:transposase
MARAREYGAAGLRARLRSGAPSRLNGSELSLVPELLAAGAEAYGFRGEMWTWARIGQLIERMFGVTYHKAHVSRLLKRLAWTPQQPRARAAPRDEDRIAYWRPIVWEALKKRRVERGVPWYWWTKAASICCLRWYALMRRVVRLQGCGLSCPAIICR